MTIKILFLALVGALIIDYIAVLHQARKDADERERQRRRRK